MVLVQGQFADLSQQYAKLTTEKENLQKEYDDLKEKYTEMSADYDETKRELKENNEELDKVKGEMVFSKQQEIQTKLTKFKHENEDYAKSIKLQQERILGLQDELQSSHIARRQYTKTIEDLEARIGQTDKEKQQSKEALAEMNAKLISSETQLDDAKHKEKVLNEKHSKEIKSLKEKHKLEVDKLEMGFQETLRQNEKKMQELQTLRLSHSDFFEYIVFLTLIICT